MSNVLGVVAKNAKNAEWTAPPASVIADAILPACMLQPAPPPTPAPNAPSQVHQLHVHSARARNASTSVDAMQTHADDTRRRKDKRIEEGRRDGIEMKEERGTRGDETLGTLKVSTHIEDSTPSNNNDVIRVTSPAPIFVRPALAPPPAFTPTPPSTTPTPPSTMPTPPSSTVPPLLLLVPSTYVRVTSAFADVCWTYVLSTGGDTYGTRG
ncbi:uncharacterized protein HD556DRAFT_1306033 [Suillus plorans]|uniref:Uncharacterized protein n=1 Tax=Suillus plorans TaxID=116603 RepID=A0A9P7DMQ8_9AGAM|nr:uncharacterized protein HD556DRAFT_1306033 [Suillus plorans]KAG1798582.1 hypothetical protein HD556DRAFT_1306033 [Suillus plorans]